MAGSLYPVTTETELVTQASRPRSTTLLTPTRVLVSDSLVGDELDFTAPEFWQWYNTFDSKGIPKRKVYGCTRYTYNSSTGSILFPTCPIADDPIAVISAGVSAAQESFGVRNASVRVVESLFKGSTSGVLPLGFEGISAFSNVKFMSWDPSMANQSQQFNYSLTQQGLSADVTCQETSNTPIQTQLLKSMEVTNSNAGGTMELRRFIVNQGNCGSNHTFVVPGIGVVAPGFCQPDATVKKYVLYLTPMGRYSRPPLSLPNMTCTFEPMIIKNIVSYSTDTGLFTSSVIEKMGGSGIPNKTADAINSLFIISTTSWGSGLIDSMLSLNTSGDGSGNFSYAGAVEAAMRGIIEYEGTNLRIYYAANEADGRSIVNGTYEVFRMGYHQTTPTALLIVLPLIVYILVVAWWYTWTGLRTGSSIDDEFNPTNSTALVTAAAAGATNGKLGLDGRGGLNDQLVQGVRIRYVGKTGLQQRLAPKASPVMSALDAEDGAGPNAPLAAEPAGSRIKCDGKQPCHNCSSRDQTCEFPGTKDNASASRYYTTSFEARCQQMDSLCQRLETLTSQLSRSLEAMHQSPGAGSLATPSEDLLRAAQVLNSLPNVQESVLGLQNASHVQGSETGNLDGNIHANRVVTPLRVRQSHVNDDLLDSSDSDDSDANNDQRQDGSAEGRDNDEIGQVGALVRDSYGRPRFIGGATHNILIEAAKSLLPAGLTTTPSSTGASQSVLSTDDLELPLFVRGKVWPELPFIPKPEDLPRPPQYIADLLISLYFDKLHYTFPVLFKPHFMRRYQKLLKAGRDCSSPKHRRFLMVFFAVCACSSSLLPSNSESELPGIEYYQKALLMFYASTGEASLERVQCLALLSMCSAGWNTLSQSWNLAGQAVRAAQDMGLHLSSRSVRFHGSFVSIYQVADNRKILSLAPEPSENRHAEFLRLQVSRRIWWCVYTLDRITSICLGRPMAVQDDDCDCALPMDMKDEDFEPYYLKSRTYHAAKVDIPSEGPCIMSGFLAFARLSRLAGKIQHLDSPLNLRKVASADSAKTQRFLSRVDTYDQALRNWLASLPPHIQFSANSMEKSPGGDPALVMCVIIFILHAGSLFNLYRCFLNYPKQAALDEEVDVSGAISQCVSAAHMCIHAAEIVRDLVPTSHYLALSVHYMTLSGIVLLRMPSSHSNPEVLDDVKKCVSFLKDVEVRWSGAKRSRVIIEQLLQHQRSKLALEHNTRQSQTSISPVQSKRNTNKRTLDDFEGRNTPRTGGENFLWGEIPGSELFPFDPLDPVLFSSWD
ncbi:fungal specific transcription factor domain-containing protein [Colletotrichum asianum]|uniref:Fungal specific transcription factor domain-containing protein n=1 Tax=Colletotrichum asianum TaxID=702518 RepID=A0A8H3WRZ8_9PEZI|nr:fungal specific transcription factor domain-containing protein [Colletotrichum asianum]